MSMSDTVPFGLRVANAANSYVVYLWKTIWPVNLAIFYPHPAILKVVSESSMIRHAAMAAILLAAITAGALWMHADSRIGPWGGSGIWAPSCR